MATTMSETSTRIPTNPATSPSVSPTAWPGPDAGMPVGTQPWPVHRHRLSCEYAGRHSAPSHHQKPSAEKWVWGEVGGGAAIAWKHRVPSATVESRQQ